MAMTNHPITDVILALAVIAVGAFAVNTPLPRPKPPVPVVPVAVKSAPTLKPAEDDTKIEDTVQRVERIEVDQQDTIQRLKEATKMLDRRIEDAKLDRPRD